MPVSPVLMPSNDRLVSTAKIDGEVISDLQVLEYKIVTNQQNVHNIGIDERIGVDYGPVFMTGSLKVRYSHPKLDTMLLTGLANPEDLGQFF